MSSPKPKKERTSQKHIGFGKVILFGEHVVVHGAPALVAGVSEYTECTIEVVATPGLEVIDQRPAVPGYIKEKREEQKKAHALVLDHHKISLVDYGLRMTIGGPLVPSSGIGASASDVVSMSRALNELYGFGLSEKEINHSAWVGEGGYHGTPSGVDNTAATFGGLLVYQRPEGKQPVFTRLPCRSTLFLVVVSTGITASTTTVVAEVRKLKDSNPTWFAAILKKYQAMYEAATSAIAAGDLKLIGSLMDLNHELCRELTLTCKELDDIVLTARRFGACGAKMSGTGRGGIAIALADSTEAQSRIATGLKKECAAAKFVWQYNVAPVANAKL